MGGLLLTLSNDILAQASASNSNLFLYILIAVVVIAVLGFLLNVSDNLMAIQAKRVGADETEPTFYFSAPERNI